MKVVAFNGSPRQGGNTEILLRHVLAPIEAAGIETEFIQLEPLAPCRACYVCANRKNRRCVNESDRLNEYLEKMLEADGIILGSPSYFADVSSNMKALIDRAGFVAVANGRLFRRKIGAAVAAHRRGGAVHVVDSINHMFLMSQMIVPGSLYWNFGVGRDKGEVENDKEALANMQDLGDTIAWLIKSLQSEQQDLPPQSSNLR